MATLEEISLKNEQINGYRDASCRLNSLQVFLERLQLPILVLAACLVGGWILIAVICYAVSISFFMVASNHMMLKYKNGVEDFNRMLEQEGQEHGHE